MTLLKSYNKGNKGGIEKHGNKYVILNFKAEEYVFESKDLELVVKAWAALDAIFNDDTADHGLEEWQDIVDTYVSDPDGCGYFVADNVVQEHYDGLIDQLDRDDKHLETELRRINHQFEKVKGVVSMRTK